MWWRIGSPAWPLANLLSGVPLLKFERLSFGLLVYRIFSYCLMFLHRLEARLGFRSLDS